MYLYHYNLNRLKDIRSLKLQDKKSDVEWYENYSSSVSFFFEPIPRDLPSIFEGKSKQWIAGSQLYEHVIDIDDIEEDIKFHITETPEKTRLLFYKQDWSKVKKGNGLRDKYLQEIEDMENKKGYRGEGLNDFVKAALPFKSGIRQYYIKAITLAQQEPLIYDLYAGTVPHVMLFPDNPIPVKSAKLIKLI